MSQRSLGLLKTISFILILSTCRDGGQFGQGFSDNDVSVRVDTILVSDFTTTSLPTFTGARFFANRNAFGGSISLPNKVTVGQYDDPLFGQLNAVGLIRPGLFARSRIDTIDSNSELFLKLVVNGMFGDTSSTLELDIYEINRPWREQSWKPDSSILESLGDRLATFTVSNEDTIHVDLPPAFIEKYGRIVFAKDRDLAFNSEFFGFAIQPRSGNKYLSINAAASGIELRNIETIVTDSTTTDSLAIDLTFTRSWASSYQRSNAQIPPTRYWLDNTREHMIAFDIPADPIFFGTENLLRAQLLIFEDQTSLNNLPPGHVRAQSPRLEVFSLDSLDLKFDINIQFPSFVPVLNREIGAFSIELTDFFNVLLINDSDDDTRFYISYKGGVLGSDRGIDGSIFQTLVYGLNSPKPPKLVITRATLDE